MVDMVQSLQSHALPYQMMHFLLFQSFNLGFSVGGRHFLGRQCNLPHQFISGDLFDCKQIVGRAR